MRKGKAMRWPGLFLILILSSLFFQFRENFATFLPTSSQTWREESSKLRALDGLYSASLALTFRNADIVSSCSPSLVSKARCVINNQRVAISTEHNSTSEEVNIDLRTSDQIRVSPRIGNPESIAPAHAYRFMTSIELADLPPASGHFCGGVLIRRRWVATAAHCVWEYKDKPDQLRLKLDCDYLTDTRGVISLAERIIIHKRYSKTDHNSFLFDIALIELSEDTPYDIEYPKMMSPDLENRLLGQRHLDPQVIGWGVRALSRVSARNNYLLEARVRIVSNEECNEPSSYSGLVNDFELCAGLTGADACHGDSGGPLLLRDNSQGYFLLGLVSWGENCGLQEKPGVYVRLSSFRNWIEDNVK